MRQLFEFLLAWHSRHARALTLLAGGATVASLFFGAGTLAWPPWWCAAIVLVAVLWLLGALEPALIVVIAPVCGHLWTAFLGGASLFWAMAGLVAGLLIAVFAAAARLARFRGELLVAPAVAGGLAVAFAAGLTAVGTTAGLRPALAAALPSLGGFVLATAGMDLLLFKDNTRGTPRLLHLAGGLYAWVYLIGAQIVLFLAGELFRLLPGDRLARVRRLGRWFMRQLVHRFPYGRCDWLGVTPHAFDRAAIVVSNHQSGLDIPVILALPGDIRLTLNQRVWSAPAVGYTARRLGHLLMEPGDPDRVLEGCRETLREGACVHFFPEGTRSYDAWPRRFHRGAFEVATTLGCDVVPVVLCDTRAGVPRNAYWVGDHHIAVRVLPPVTPDEFDYARGSRDLMKHVQELVRAAFLEELDRINTPGVLRRKVACFYHYQGPGVEAAVRRVLRVDPLLARLKSALPRTGRVLDLQCGYGVGAHWLTELNPRLEVVGVEADVDCVRVARRSATGKARLSFLWEPCALPEADAAIVREADETLLARLAVAVRPGGTLVLQAGAVDDPGQIERAGFVRRGDWLYERGASA